jgi:hypothetical protein
MTLDDLLFLFPEKVEWRLLYFPANSRRGLKDANYVCIADGKAANGPTAFEAVRNLQISMGIA